MDWMSSIDWTEHSNSSSLYWASISSATLHSKSLKLSDFINIAVLSGYSTMNVIKMYDIAIHTTTQSVTNWEFSIAVLVSNLIFNLIQYFVDHIVVQCFTSGELEMSGLVTVDSVNNDVHLTWSENGYRRTMDRYIPDCESWIIADESAGAFCLDLRRNSRFHLTLDREPLMGTRAAASAWSEVFWSWFQNSIF